MRNLEVLGTMILVNILTILAEAKDEIIAIGGIATILVALATGFLTVLKIIDWFKKPKE